jgi:hypothetical protein
MAHVDVDVHDKITLATFSRSNKPCHLALTRDDRQHN